MDLRQGRLNRSRPERLLAIWGLRDYLQWIARKNEFESETSAESFKYVGAGAAGPFERADRFLTPQEVRSIDDVMTDPRNRAFFYLLIDTALRTSELVRLTPSHVRTTEQPRLVVPNRSDGHRAMILSDRTYSALRTYLKATGRTVTAEKDAPIFRTLTRPRMSTRTILRILEDLGERAGLNHGVTVRSIRWTAGFHRLLESSNLAAVADWLGHAGLDTTRDWYDPFLSYFFPSPDGPPGLL